ncbi:hypothetical protein G6011_04272 [Alternaria panax]|uniref:Uncharacterized protein n=1 Tax=Alternaria panax TaxID=48097 RepID=A0AAD4IGP8_9PLEO|nr:hypothetical protein G6011_04272 [Alternaria panax]
MSTLESRVASLSLGGHIGWQCRIDLALSESSACSSPTSEVYESGHTSDDDTDDDADDEADIVDASFGLSALVRYMVNSLPTTGERPLLEYFFWNPVTLADVEALVPALIKSSNIMDQLAMNIGYFHAYGRISSPVLERILIHLLAAGDDQNHLYETTKARIELERSRRRHWEYVDRQKRVMNFEKIDIMINSVQHCETIGDFTRSRLHSGPGLTDRKHAKVRLPQNVRPVGAMPKLLVPEMNTRVEHDFRWVKSRPTLVAMFGRKQKGSVVVKLPPKEPAPLA